MKVDFVDLEANLFNFYSALLVEVDFGDLRQILFLQCSSCRGRFRWPEARDCFLQWITLDIQTPGFLEIVVADSTLTCFCVCFRFSSFPLKWFPASKRSLWDQAFPCLGNGQHGPHVAPGFLLLPRCGWCRWAPLQVTWRQSATVVSPDQELDLWNSETGYCHSGTLSFSFLILEVIDYFWLLFDLAHYLSKQPDLVILV